MTPCGSGKNTVRSALLLAALVTQSACLIVGSHGPTRGDIALLWEFEGSGTCLDAGVDSIVVTIRGQNVSEHFETALNCEDGGATFEDFLQGSYSVHVEAVDYEGYLLYATTVTADVYGGELTDLGALLLYSSLPPPRTGSLQIDWTFYYPDQTATPDCAYAGVDYVGLALVDAAGVVIFEQSVRCLDGPAIIDNIDDGRYTVEISGLGSYHGRSVVLYDTAPFAVDIYAGELTDLGFIDLNRVTSSFGDLQIGWTFGRTNSCSVAGVSQVHLTIVRAVGNQIDDELTVYCDEEPQYRQTFVPGSYVVQAEGLDSGGYAIWYGEAAASVPPGGFADVTVIADPVD